MHRISLTTPPSTIHTQRHPGRPGVEVPLQTDRLWSQGSEARELREAGWDWRDCWETCLLRRLARSNTAPPPGGSRHTRTERGSAGWREANRQARLEEEVKRGRREGGTQSGKDRD